MPVKMLWYPQWTKGHTVGEEPIFAPVSLLSFRVRPVRVNQAPRRDKNWLLSDSLTLTIDISVIYKEDDWGVLDVRWLRTTQKITEISWFRACVPLSTEGICMIRIFLSPKTHYICYRRIFSTPFLRHSPPGICSTSALMSLYITCRRYFGAKTIWYLHSHFVWAKLFVVSILGTSCVVFLWFADLLLY